MRHSIVMTRRLSHVHTPHRSATSEKRLHKEPVSGFSVLSAVSAAHAQAVTPDPPHARGIRRRSTSGGRGRRVQLPLTAPFESTNDDLRLLGVETPAFEDSRIEIHDPVFGNVPTIERPLGDPVTAA